MVSRGVSSRFRFERRRELGHDESEAAHHLAQHVIGGEAHPACAGLRIDADLHRRVAVAQVIRGTRQRTCVGAHRLHERLVGRGDANDAPVVAAQAIAAAQDRAALEEQPDLLAIDQPRAQPAFLALLERKPELGVVSLLRGDALADDQHGIVQNRK